MLTKEEFYAIKARSEKVVTGEEYFERRIERRLNERDYNKVMNTLELILRREK